MSSKPRGAIRSTRSINSIDNGSSGDIEFGLHPITNKPAAARLFLYGVDPKNATLKCCTMSQLSKPLMFNSGYRKPSYPSMRMFA